MSEQVIGEQIDDFALPNTSDINRDLFAEDVEKYKDDIDLFDVDEFLMKNNLQYVQLDSLIRNVDDLSREMVQDLSDEVTNKYEDYIKFCSTYVISTTGSQHYGENESLLELQKTQTNLHQFMSQLEQLISKDIPRTREVITDTISYMNKINEIGNILSIHIKLTKQLMISQQLSDSLHSLCDNEELEEEICFELTNQLNQLVSDIHDDLDSLADINSPYINHLRNEYQGLVQTFQIALKLLIERCLTDPTKYKKLTSVLLSILKNPHSS